MGLFRRTAQAEHAKAMADLEAKDNQVNTLIAAAFELVGDLRNAVDQAGEELRKSRGEEQT